jgi:phytoene/squalene synthetase
MEAMRNSWTDDRLDDFRAETQRRFDEVDQRFDRLERRMENGFSELNARIDAMQQGLQQAIFDLQRLMFRASIAVILALIAILATQL